MSSSSPLVVAGGSPPWSKVFAVAAIVIIGVAVVLAVRSGGGSDAPDTLRVVSPVRVLDSRADGETVDGAYAARGPIGGDETLEVAVAGRGSLPEDDVAAVVVNVQVVDATASTFLTLFPAASGRPGISNVDVAADESVSAAAVVAVDDDGRIAVYNRSGQADVVIDVLGWFDADAIGTVVPARLVDTRPDRPTIDGEARGTGALEPGETRWFPVSGRGQVPDSDVAAVVLDVAAVSAEAGGHLVVGAAGESSSRTSNVSVEVGQSRSNMVVVPVGDDGQIEVVNAAGPTHVVIDVLAYLPESSGFGRIEAARLVDTRADGASDDGLFVGGGPVDADRVLNVQVGGRGGVPDDAGSVVLNLTARGATESTWLTVAPAGVRPPRVANLTLAPARTQSNAVVVALGTDGQVSIHNGAGAVDVVVDVLAWFPAGDDERPGNSLVLRPDGLGDVDFGDAPGDAISAAGEVYGGSADDRTVAFDVATLGDARRNDDGSLEFTYEVGREVCFDGRRLCLYLGGRGDSLRFVGYRYGAQIEGVDGPELDGRLFDVDGVSTWSRAADRPGLIDYGRGGCGEIGVGVSESGLALVLQSTGEPFTSTGEADGNEFVASRPDDDDVHVVELAAGERFDAVDDDC